MITHFRVEVKKKVACSHLEVECFDDVAHCQAAQRIDAFVVILESSAKICDGVIRVAEARIEDRFLWNSSLQHRLQSPHMPHANM
jgi:hypothetical protein